MAERGANVRLAVLGLLALAAVIAFMTIGAHGRWSFVLPFRGTKLLAMLLVAHAVALSTVLFQTMANNRILTPSIMGFDALYLLIQTVIVFWLGSANAAAGDPLLRFLGETALLTGFACTLFFWLFSGAVRSLHLMMLVGILLGLLFRSLSSLMIRLIDPNEFLVLQDRMFASFNNVQTGLLGVVALAVLGASLVAWRLRHRYDVIALGREIAINLGVDYRRTLLVTLVLVAVLVSVSTALVGPVIFFGLLVSNLAWIVMGSDRHRHVVPAAILIAVICLVGGQTLLERGLALQTPVSVVVEFLGGLLFLFLVTRRVRR